MTLDNFNNGAKRSAVEHYAGTMQPLTLLDTSVDWSHIVGTTDDLKPRHRRATRYKDYLVYCNQVAANAFNIYFHNGVEQNVVNIKVDPTLGANWDFIGHWHLKATKDGFQFFFPVAIQSGSFYSINAIQYGEVRITSNGNAVIEYDKHRTTNSIVASPSGPPCGFVDVGNDVYFFVTDRNGIQIMNVYYPSVENLTNQPDIDHIVISGSEYGAYGVSSADSDENFIYFTDAANTSYGLSIVEANEDYTKITVMPAEEVLQERYDDEPTYEVIRTTVFGDPATVLGTAFYASRGDVTDGNELPLWHSKRLGISFYDKDDEFVSVVKGSNSKYYGTYGTRYVWLGLDGGRAYIPYYNPTDGFYYTASLLETSGQTNKTIRQKGATSGYLPVPIPVEGELFNFITYYANANDHYYYYTKSLPSIIENDKGVFYPEFVGDESGSVTLGNSNYLRYERIGNIVHVFGVVEPTANTGIGALVMNNLPYPVSNEFADTDFTLDQASKRLCPIRKVGSGYYSLNFCTSQADHTLSAVTTVYSNLTKWAFNFRYMTN